MDLEAVATLGEIIGAIAIVISLVYLGAQIRQSTNVARRAAASEAIAAVREINDHIIRDRSLNDLYRRGLNGVENLSEDEFPQFWLLTMNLFKTVEHLHFQFVHGAMDEEVWSGWEWLLGRYVTSPGGLHYYQERKRAFSPIFREWMDNQISDTEFQIFGRAAS